MKTDTVFEDDHVTCMIPVNAHAPIKDSAVFINRFRWTLQ